MVFRCIYILYIHPELRIDDYRFRPGQGAQLLWREQRKSNEGATREQGGAPREQEKYAGRSLFWLLVLVEAQRKGG